MSALAAQVYFKASDVPVQPAVEDLSKPPSEVALRLATFGDPVPAAKLLTLLLQSFDYSAGNPLAFQKLDYEHLIGWLERLLALDPSAGYPLMLASRIYADVPDEARQRKMLEFIHSQFMKDPGRRWPWLAHATVIARHRLQDLPLARRFAADIQTYADGEDVPLWALQMEAFILEDMNELQAARIMLGGFIEKGMVKDPGELRFMEGRLREIERRLSPADAPANGRPASARPIP